MGRANMASFILPLLLSSSILSCSLGSGQGASAAATGYPPPANCASLECPSYVVVQSNEEFEIRKYAKSTWMNTPPISARTCKEASQIGFNYLFSYIQGKNAQGAKIDMTAPVLVDVAPSTGPFCNSTFVMHFYVPAKYQNGPPASSEVHPVMWPAKSYAAVRRFSGFMDDSSMAAEAAALRKSLDGTQWGSAVQAEARSGKGAYTVAGYNSPFEYTNRVNEVMFLF